MYDAEFIREERHSETVRRYKDRIRIFVILYVFGRTLDDPNNPQRKKRFDTEMRLQKIDFLLRYPDYFAFELLKLAEEGKANRDEIKKIVRSILDEREPELRRHEMQRFFFGSYEDIDDVIAFLKSVDFVEFSSEKALDMKTINKIYFVTKQGVDRLEGMIDTLPLIGWYVERAELIKRFFGMKSAAELKRMQYLLDEIKSAGYRESIAGITHRVEQKYDDLYGGTISETGF